MPDLIHWLDDWLLEIPEIDDEHREMVDLLNHLVQCQCRTEAHQGNVSKFRRDTAIMEMLEELGRHVRRHFKHEEACMLEAAYPQYEDHRYEHMTLLAEYAELLRDVRERGMQCLDAETLAALKGWLIGHIAGADRRFGDYHSRTRAGVPKLKQKPFDLYWTGRANGN